MLVGLLSQELLAMLIWRHARNSKPRWRVFLYTVFLTLVQRWALIGRNSLRNFCCTRLCKHALKHAVWTWKETEGGRANLFIPHIWCKGNQCVWFVHAFFHSGDAIVRVGPPLCPVCCQAPKPMGPTRNQQHARTSMNKLTVVWWVLFVSTFSVSVLCCPVVWQFQCFGRGFRCFGCVVCCFGFVMFLQVFRNVLGADIIPVYVWDCRNTPDAALLKCFVFLWHYIFFWK